jgi:hypothetical protein
VCGRWIRFLALLRCSLDCPETSESPALKVAPPAPPIGTTTCGVFSRKLAHILGSGEPVSCCGVGGLERNWRIESPTFQIGSGLAPQIGVRYAVPAAWFEAPLMWIRRVEARCSSRLRTGPAQGQSPLAGRDRPSGAERSARERRITVGAEVGRVEGRCRLARPLGRQG